MRAVNWVKKLPYLIVLVWIVMAVLGSFVGDSAIEVQLDKLLQSGSVSNWLGYDQLGRPVWDRLLMGAQTSFLVAVSVVVFSALIGTTIGVYSAYVGGWADKIIIKVIDVFLAFHLSSTEKGQAL